MSVGTIHDNYPTDFLVVTTVDAVSTYLMSHDFTPNSACHVNVRVICRNPATGEAKGWHWETMAKRVGSGTPSAVGAVLKLLDGVGDVALALAAISVVVSGGNVSIRVAGLASTALEWYGSFSALCIENP